MSLKERSRVTDDPRTKAELLEEVEALHRQLTELRNAECARRLTEEEHIAREGRLYTLTEITAYQESQKRLEEKERVYRAVVDGISDALFLVKPEPGGDFRYVFINPACTLATGLSPDEIIGQRVSEFFPTAYANWVRARYTEAMEAGKTIEFEETAEVPSGRITVVTRLTPIYDANGVCFQLVGAARNITEQKQAERSLRKTNRRLVNILESITDAFFSVDRQWRLSYLNPKAEALIKRSRQDVIGRNLWEAFPEVANTSIYHECHRALAKQVAVSVEEMRLPDGRWLQCHAYPSQDSLSIYIQNISERKGAEEQIRLHKERMRRSVDSIARAMALAVEIRDPYTAGHQRRVSTLASAMAREMGMDEETVEVIRIAGLVHDIGKISIPAEILSKPGRISDAEASLIRMHAQVGYDILKEIDFAPPIALVALQHHERLDGTGYPAGLKEEDIILEARIMAVADVVEAMASHRPYRPGLGIERALKEVLQYKGVRYHTPSVESCLRVFEQHAFDFEQLMQSETAGR